MPKRVRIRTPEQKRIINERAKAWAKSNPKRIAEHERRRHLKDGERRRAAGRARTKAKALPYPQTARGLARAEGLRSGFERTLTVSMKNRKAVYQYEPVKLDYVLNKRYVPDFYIPATNIYIEAKGKLTPEDRTKMIAVKKCHPELDIRFCFMRGANTLTSKSKMTYMAWAEKNGFPAADGEIPDEWLHT